MTNDNVISFEQTADSARRRVADARVREIVGRIRDVVAETLPRLMQDLFEHMDDELYAQADRSGSDALQSRYFEAMRELRMLRETIERQFNQARLREFDNFWIQRATVRKESAQAQDDEEMSLVAEEALEEDLAITSMVSKSENRFHRELFALNLRFGALLGGLEVNDTANPLGPRMLAEGFAEALSQWSGETAVKLLIYKLFDRYVMAYTGGLYDDVNDVLVTAEVLPKIVQRVRRNPVAPSVQRARDPQSDEVVPRGEGGQAFAGGENEVLGALVGLLARQRAADSRDAATAGRWMLGGAHNPSLPEVSTQDLLSALSSVQPHTLRAAPVDLNEVHTMQAELLGSLGRELELASDGMPVKRLGHADQDMLEVMGMLFDFVLGDDNLPEAMKALLGRLQIPLIKVALSDRGFFNNSRHPARVLLNNLARAAVAWTDDGDRSANSAYGQIESAVNRILTDYVDDISVFDTVNEEFSQYLERERRNAEVAEERVGQVKRGQEQLELARRRVSEVIQGYVDACYPPECAIPDPVARLLDEAWHDVLLLAYLREGEQSVAWRSASEIVEQLIWSVQPKTDQLERQKLLKSIPELLQRVREGLVNISFDQHRSSVLFKELQACHIAALRGARVEPEGAAESAQPEAAVEDVPAADVEETTVPDDRFQQMAATLEVGQWLEWEVDGEWQRGKLSWRSEVTGTCIFVNRKGLKVAEMSVNDIAQRLREDHARQLKNIETPLMDRALNAMLDALQRSDPDAPQPA